MIPAGYLLKRVLPPPGWLKSGPTHIVEVCSVSDCVNDNVVDIQESWQHNGFGLASTPNILLELARKSTANLAESTLFYYEVYEQEIESDGWVYKFEDWRDVTPVPSSSSRAPVIEPSSANIILLGYDVVTCGDYLEHSPLSCNSIASALPVNRHCLFDELAKAKEAINTGAFSGGCEPGVYKIFSVSSVADWTVT